MKINLTCREATRLVLQGEDRSLSLAERAALRLHLVICSTCPTFVRQVEFMRTAMGRWKRYAEDDTLPPAAPPAPPGDGRPLN